MPTLLQKLSSSLGSLRHAVKSVFGARGEIRPRTKRSRHVGDRDEAIKQALEDAAAREALRDPERMFNVSYKLISLELFEQAWELRTRAAALQRHDQFPEWDGGDLSKRSILIRSYAEDRIGEDIRFSRFIAPVAKRARHCVVLAEPRLVPLLRRSFPGVDVRTRGVDDGAALAEVDVVAYYETIALHYAKTKEEMLRSFFALRPDPSRVASIRQRYRAISSGPLIGISWWSTNKKKDLPSLESWAPLLQQDALTFVTLQYGDIARDLELLQSIAGSRVVHDAEFDQLVDLDGFAAQIAALDAVVSISNTTIDMAGMLGSPTLHIRGDKKSASLWPYSGPSPWYPGMTFLYKESRHWSEVFLDARRHVEQMLQISDPDRDP
jgi:hypothetical protein